MNISHKVSGLLRERENELIVLVLLICPMQLCSCAVRRPTVNSELQMAFYELRPLSPAGGAADAHTPRKTFNVRD